MDRPGTVSATGIAKLAGVGRAAVSNWRRRHADFPQPVGGTATSPTFELDDVEKWLAQQGKLPNLSPRERVWRQIESTSDGTELADSVCLAGALLLARWAGTVEGRDVPSPEELVHAIAALDESAAALIGSGFPGEWSPQQHDVLSALGELAREPNADEVFEYLYWRYVSARGSASDFTTPPILAQLMLDLAGPARRVFDFACGTGTLVSLAAARALTDKTPVDCCAQDIDETAARITQLRLLFAYRRATLAGVGGQAPVVRHGDSLLADAFPGLQADVVVANPPFGLHNWGHEQLAYDPRWEFGGLPPKTEPELAWVQHALAHVKPGGYAVLLMPPAAADRSAGRRIRGELLRRGALRAVIALPARLLPHTAIALHLWVLRRPLAEERSPGHVLFVDTAAEFVDKAAVSDTAVSAWRAFIRDSASVDDQPGVRRVVPVIDLLDEVTDLSPHAHIPLPGDRRLDPSELLAARDALDAQLVALRARIPSLVTLDDSPLAAARTVTLDELVKTGGLVRHRWPMRNAPGDDESAELPAVTGRDVIQGAPPSGSVPRMNDSEAAVVRDGDVLIPQIGESVVARVATPEQVGAHISTTVQGLRVNADVLDPWFLAGVLSTSQNTRIAARHSSTMAGRMRIDLKRLQVPVVPLDLQRRYGEAFRRVAEFESAMARAAEHGRALARDFAEGLASGVLGPDTDSITPGNAGKH
jgi:SAM-dependent methyltransferase